MKKRAILITSLILTAGLASCSKSKSGGEDASLTDSKNSSDYSAAPSKVAGALSGTAATGAAIPGAKISIKCANNTTISTDASATGKWSKSVSGCSAPFLIRAVGSVGGKKVDLLSAATSDSVGDIVNITPMTHLITANLVGGGEAKAAFDAFDPTDNTHIEKLDSAKITAEETKLKTALKEVILAAAGVSSVDDIDLMNMPFSTDHSGMDALLDTVKINITGNSIAVKLMDDTAIFTDDATADDTPTVAVDLSANINDIKDSIGRYQEVASKLKAFIASIKANATAISTAATAQDLPASVGKNFTSDFIEEGLDASAFIKRAFGIAPGLADYNESVADVKIDFGNISLFEKSSGVYTVFFDLMFDGELEEMGNTVDVKLVDGTYKLYGNQIATDVYLDFKIYKEYSNTGDPNTNINTKFYVNLGSDYNDEVSFEGTEAQYAKLKIKDGAAVTFEDPADRGTYIDKLVIKDDFNNSPGDLLVDITKVNPGYNEYVLSLYDSNDTLLVDLPLWIQDPRESFDDYYFPAFTVESSSFTSAEITKDNVDAFCSDDGNNLAISVSNADHLQLEHFWAYVVGDNLDTNNEPITGDADVDVLPGSATSLFTMELTGLGNQTFKDFRAYYNGPGSTYVLNILCK